ncbi:hypothetical protein Bpfe_026561 [Biomphalaria pfeifferi]|uniref:Uncharacterized protein n=1 Tax=Biomphalaria pfeifferi TaxID=112525 RepID=A0AAD8EXC5_BIOPF|nr:hypothetical protein Bpfe_026561 [Biomphalaria pfeifferi]
MLSNDCCRFDERVSEFCGMPVDGPHTPSFATGHSFQFFSRLTSACLVMSLTRRRAINYVSPKRLCLSA